MWKALDLGGTRFIALLRTLILARLLVPEDFGLLAIGLVSVEVSISLTNFGMREALIQRSAPTARQYETAWTFEMMRGIGVALVLVLAAPLMANTVFGDPRATRIIQVLALIPVIDHASSIKLIDLTRELRFRPLAFVNLIGTVVHAVIAIVLAPTLGVWALVVGYLAGTLIQTVVSYVVAPNVPRPSLDREAAQPLFQFGRWIFVTQVIEVAGAGVLQAVVARQLGTGELGLYFLAARLAFLPSDVVRKVVGVVAFPVHAVLQEETDRARRTLRASLAGMWGVLLPVYAVGLVLVEDLLQLTVGQGWKGAAPVIRVLAVAAVIKVVSDAALPMFQGRGRTDWMAGLYAVRSLVMIVLVWEMAQRFGVVGAGYAWVCAEVLGLVYCVVMIRRLLERPFAGLITRTGAFVLAGAGGALTSRLLSDLVPGLWGVGGALLAGVLVAALVVRSMDMLFRLHLAADLVLVFPSLSRFLPTPPPGRE